VVNISDDYDAADRERFRKRFSTLFDSIPPTFHFVSGKTGLGVKELAKRIASIDGRIDAAHDNLRKLAQDLRNWVEQYRISYPYQRLTFWHPASWADLEHNFEEHELTHILQLDNKRFKCDLSPGGFNDDF
jgi:transglutaminase-like putative cysteine protease